MIDTDRTSNQQLSPTENLLQRVKAARDRGDISNSLCTDITNALETYSPVETTVTQPELCEHPIINTSEVRDGSYGRCWCHTCGKTMPWRYGPNGVKHAEPIETVPAAEHDRYKRCLYRANGRLIQLGQEAEKLDYSDRTAEEPTSRIGWCGDTSASPHGPSDPPDAEPDWDLVCKDATRYEWLRKNWRWVVTHQSCGAAGRQVDLIEVHRELGQETDPQSLDQAIDAAIVRETEGSTENGSTVRNVTK